MNTATPEVTNPRLRYYHLLDASALLSHDADEILRSEQPVTDTSLKVLEDLARTAEEVRGKLYSHKLSYRHTDPEANKDWQELIDHNKLIEGIKKIREQFGYDLRCAKALACAYRQRHYAYKHLTHPSWAQHWHL